MCSVSWIINESGYHVFFNRDEQKSRALALPPRQLNVNGVEVLMPIDPAGNGSWVSLNEFGLSLCLLNNYQGVVPSRTLRKSDLVSRGLLLKQLSGYANIKQIEHSFHQLNLNQFAPFTLLVFSPVTSSTPLSVVAFAWNGQESSIYPTECPLFSSSVDVDAVKAYRLEQFRQFTADDNSVDSLLKFHAHHHPDQMHLSTCMHRADAQTVSMTYLNVSKSHQFMAYVPGSPCEHLSKQAIEQNQYQLCHKTSLVS
ncbi:NRDE family protein [Vibrio lamellibrachiae]|uniref:NRDE family protein n=1 Tax=Vibrio lamellibrachiae TaxID=2910253 RepID=UPI003D13AA43